MADEQKHERARGAAGVLGAIVGALVSGKRSYDRLIVGGFGAGFAGVAFVLLLRAWNADRVADRVQRAREHQEMIETLREQHREDIHERRYATCVNAQLNDTVRAAIWHEKPRAREACQ